ncbi:MAG TPA: anti-sigma factor domain-containing protein [Clostridia bacterium]
MKKSGIVLKIRNAEAVVINDHGEYQRIKFIKGMFEGQFVEYEEKAVLKETGRFKYMVAVASAAAVLIIIGVLLFGVNNNNIYAFIDLDTNPSMEFTIDDKNHVVDLKIFDKKTVFPVKSNDVKGMSINHAVVYVVSNLRKSGNIKSDDNNVILISAVNVNEQSQQKDQKLTGIVESLKSEIIKSTGQELKVESIIPLADTRKSSVENNISMGRYTLYTNALKNGVDITIDTAKKSDINDLIKYKNLDSKSETNQNNSKPIENTPGKKPRDKNSSLSSHDNQFAIFSPPPGNDAYALLPDKGRATVNHGISVNHGMASDVGTTKTGIQTGPVNNGCSPPNIHTGYNNQNIKDPMDNTSPRGDGNFNPDKPIPPPNISGPDEHDKANKGIMPGNLPPVGGAINGGKGLPDITPPPNISEGNKGNKGMMPGSTPPIESPPVTASPGGKQLPPNMDSQKQSGGLNMNGGIPYNGSQPAAGSHSGINGIPAPNMNPGVPKDHQPPVQPSRPQGQENGGRRAPEPPRFEPPNRGVPPHR